jgi:aryl-alcohol dehydrogenase-like predicted oxidoreductase
MQTRPLGQTGLQLPILSFGASSLGQEFRQVSLEEALRSVRVALELGLNFIDTSPFYGRGMSEVLLGVALRDVPRQDYILGTKLGRYDAHHFDFSARRVVESVDISLHRLGLDYLDIVLCHDIEFVEMQQIVDETLPALRKIRDQGKVRFIGVSGYPMKLFKFVLEQTDLDVVLSYNQYTLQNTRLADELIPLPENQKCRNNECRSILGTVADKRATAALAQGTGKRARGCAQSEPALRRQRRGSRQTRPAILHCKSDIATTVAGSANPENIRKWVEWAADL